MYQPNYGYQYPYYGTNGAMPDNLTQLRMNQGQMQNPVMAQPTPPQVQSQPNSGLIWVQGEAGAKSYLVAPGNTVMLMDSEGKRFYLKSADTSGMPMPLRVFEYKECLEVASQAFGEPMAANQPNLDNFVTREEFEQRMASMASQCQCKNHSKNNLAEVSENV